MRLVCKIVSSALLCISCNNVYAFTFIRPLRSTAVSPHRIACRSIITTTIQSNHICSTRVSRVRNRAVKRRINSTLYARKKRRDPDEDDTEPDFLLVDDDDSEDSDDSSDDDDSEDLEEDELEEEEDDEIYDEDEEDMTPEMREEARQARAKSKEDGDSDSDDEEESYVKWQDAEDRPPGVDMQVPWWETNHKELFLAVCIDKDDAQTFAKVRRPRMIDHMIWVRRSARIHEPPARVVFDRPLLTPDMSHTMGNLICISAMSRADAEALLSQEPYSKAGLFATRTLYAWPKNKAMPYCYDIKQGPYAAVCMDKPDALPKRLATRAEHLNYLASLKSVFGAAPLIPLPKKTSSSDAPNSPVGSVVFFAADNQQQAEDIVRQDPYNKAGVFASTQVFAVCELDVEGLSPARIHEIDPVRDAMELEGLTIETDYPPAAEAVPPLDLMNI